MCGRYGTISSGWNFLRVPEEHEGQHWADDSKRIRSQDGRDVMMKNFFAATQTIALLITGGFSIHSQVTAPSAALAADKAELIDLNPTISDELKALPGIDGAYSENIIEGSPYKRKDELVQKKLSQATYEKMKIQVIAKRK
jgi:DNA uptake protein ComE-like DNA-binding protein